MMMGRTRNILSPMTAAAIQKIRASTKLSNESGVNAPLGVRQIRHVLFGQALEVGAVTSSTMLRENLLAESHRLPVEPERARDAVNRDCRQLGRPR